jgi:membrane protease YdiL (CAAX protease family)
LVAALLASVAVWVMGVARPGGLDKNRRNVTAFPALLWMSGAVIVYAAGIVGGTLAAGIARLALPADTTSARALAISTLGSMALALVAGVTLARLASRKQRNSGMRVRTGDLRRGVVAFLIVMPFVLATSTLGTLIYLKVQGHPPDNAAHALLRMYRDTPNDPWVWVLLASAVLGAPIVEELTYRAFLQTGFLALFQRTWLAIMTTSLLFTLAHLGGEGSPTVPWHALPTLFVLSLGMGIAYERSGRLGVPILMHMLFNASQVGLMLWMMHRA